MITVSLCMIVKNEEAVLARCLDTIAHLVDEIIIVDTGSTDQTKAIAQRYNAKIYDFVWIDDFAAARNNAFSHATKDYILWLDADDVLEESEQSKFEELKQTLDPEVDAVSMLYHLAFDAFGNLSFSLRRNRLVKRIKNFQWRGVVHEYLEVYGKLHHSDVAITHRSSGGSSDRNLKIYQRRLENNEEFSPRDLYYYGNELVDHGLYREAIPVYEKFLSGGKGWIEDNIACCGKLADCDHRLGQKEQELASVLRSFGYDSPRPEFCCRLGYHFLQVKNYLSAIFWYKLATQIKQDTNYLGFNNLAYSTWLPHLQLCVAYSNLGAHRLAYVHNEAARHYRPEDPTILRNKQFLEASLELQDQN